MAIIPAKTPLIAKKICSNYIWDISTTSKTVYLTFDDGPTPNITNWTLKTLKDYNAKATFFCIGKNIEKNPAIFKNILKEGHHIGNHTHSHIKGWKTSSKKYIENIKEAKNYIEKETLYNHENVSLFRPPYGQITPKQGKKLIALGYKIIMWDVLSFDWDNNVSETTCLNNVISNTKNGSIVVFHDSFKAKKNMTYALPKVLEHFSKLNYSFSALN